MVDRHLIPNTVERLYAVAAELDARANELRRVADDLRGRDNHGTPLAGAQPACTHPPGSGTCPSCTLAPGDEA